MSSTSAVIVRNIIYSESVERHELEICLFCLQFCLLLKRHRTRIFLEPVKIM